MAAPAPRQLDPCTRTAQPQRQKGLGAWLAQERVFRLIPFLLVEGIFLTVLAIPFGLTVYISLLSWRANRPFEQATFQGFANYVRVLNEPEFWCSLGRTLYFASAAVGLELLLGFCLAMLLSKDFPGRKTYLTIFLMPMMVVPVVTGYNFSMLYIDSGPLNQLLAPFLEPLGIDPRIRWLSHPMAAQWGIILADVWQWTSLTLLIFLAGFAALPPEVSNAARVLGATRWQIFWRIQLPLLKPVIVMAVVIRGMEALKLFDQVMLLTFGGPGNSTQTIAFFLWREVWQFNKYSFGAAASIVLLVLFAGLIYAAIYLLVRQRALVYDEESRA